MEGSKTVREQMFSLLSQWEVSRLSKKEFCSQHHISYHRFHYWYKRYRGADAASPNQQSATFMPLRVDSDCSHTEVVLPGGVRIIFHQQVTAAYLQQLIR